MLITIISRVEFGLILIYVSYLYLYQHSNITTDNRTPTPNKTNAKILWVLGVTKSTKNIDYIGQQEKGKYWTILNILTFCPHPWTPNMITGGYSYGLLVVPVCYDVL